MLENKMAKFLLFIALFIVHTSVNAELFKWVDENGEVIYSDQPPPASKNNQQEYKLDEEKLPPLISTPALRNPLGQSTSSNKAEENQIQSVSITYPEHDTAVRNNEGTLNIQLAVSPELNPKSGESVVVLMDGVEVYRGKGSQVTLLEVDRGTHTLEAKMLSPSGQTISSSEPVTFTLQRYSALF